MNLPLVQSLKGYNGKKFRGDLLAGITVWIMLIPQGMAYAMLSGLPPIYGLYAGFVPLLIYGIFGTSRKLSLGPVALDSLLVLAGISQFADRGSELFIQLAITTALIAGIMQVIFGLLKLGFLVNFLSHPVISGFTSAAALIIGFSQLGKLFGLELKRASHVHEILVQLVEHITAIHWLTFAIGIAGVAIILLLKRWNKKLPGALIAVILGTAAVFFFHLHQQGVAIVGTVPEGVPAFQLPRWHWQEIRELLPLSFTLCLISFIESLAIAKALETDSKYKVIPNKEVIALGLAKVGGAFFSASPTAGSFTRSAINSQAGAETGLSSILTAILMGLTLLVLTPLFYFLPHAVLAAIVVAAVIGLVNIKEAIHLWKNDKRDFFMLLTTFLGTLVLGIQEGILMGMALSLIVFVYRNSVPHVAVLGKLPTSTMYKNISRFPDAIQQNDILIVRFDAQLYFGNANYFADTLKNLIEQKGKQLRLFILDASSIHDIDTSGLYAFTEILDYLELHQIQFYLSGAIGPVRDILHKNGLMERIGQDCQFLRIHDAMTAFEKVDSEDGKPVV
ncbi:MAG: solute carrier family 26 protein [Phaeodactylibacter sp.]|nr:solute carrier family 26 protein [Phaeodactylibacter sp.]